MRDVIDAGCERSDVCAVTVWIVDSAFASEIKLYIDSASDLVVILVDAGVEHRNVDVFSFESAVAGLRPHERCARSFLYVARHLHVCVYGNKLDFGKV